tara:strand:+ start:296 stop:550 length:255 start_codon:yes stop_codon:yes gene_type:complete
MSLLCRRGLLKTRAAASVIAATGLTTKVTAKRGGMLRLGLNGANSSDSFDGQTHYDTFMINMGHGSVFDCLTASSEWIGQLAIS